MKVTVLGCGALGQLWLTALYKHGHEVQGWLRVPQPFCSVNVIDTDGSVFNESFIANDPDFLASSDLLLVTLKAWQVSNAVKNLSAILPSSSPVLLMHNGMGTVDELKSIRQPLLMASTTQAARRDGNVIVHVANGTSHIGPAKNYPQDYSYLADVLQGVLPDVAWHNNIYPAIWSKLAVNCVINPLTALKNCHNGALREYPQEVADICYEVAAVMEREGMLADAPLVEVADGDFDIIILPGGIKGAECFRDSPLLVETVRQFHLSGRIVAAICAAAATVLVPHNLFPIGNMTGFPGLKDRIPAGQWQDRRVVWDARVKLLTSQAPGTSIDFALKIIDLLVGREKAHEVASQLVMAAGIYNYYEA